MNRNTEPILVTPLIIALILGGGCICGTPDCGSPQPTPTGFFALNPVSVYITSPDFDGGVDAGTVTVTVAVRNFSVVDRIGDQNKPGEGHIVYFRDVTPPVTPGLPVATQPGTFQISTQTSCTWYNVTPGTHTFAVELVNNNNTPLMPPVIDAVDVTAVPEFGGS